MTTSSGDEVARFRSAFERHYDTLLLYALQRTGSREDAEEVVAATFAIAWRRVDRLALEPYTLTWLYRVAWRTLANQRRSDDRRERLASRLAMTRPEEEADPTEQEAMVHDALARLRPQDQALLRLVAWQELSCAEAAEVLGCTQNAFALRLHRAPFERRPSPGPEAAPPEEGPEPSP